MEVWYQGMYAESSRNAVARVASKINSPSTGKFSFAFGVVMPQVVSLTSLTAGSGRVIDTPNSCVFIAGFPDNPGRVLSPILPIQTNPIVPIVPIVCRLARATDI